MKKFSKGGSMDDNEVWSNLPKKNAVEQKWEARKKPSEARSSGPIARNGPAKVKKFGIGGLIEAASPLSVLDKRPLTFRTLLDPAGIFTDDNISQDYKKKMAEKKEKEAMANRGYAKGGSVRGHGCAIKSKKKAKMR